MKKLVTVVAMVTSLLLVGCAKKQPYDEMILKINDKLYYGSEETGPMGDSGCIGGEITSTVDVDDMPTENGCSNFGCVGNSYTRDEGDGFIMVFMENGEWRCFYAEK